MTPKEIVERVRETNDEAREYSTFSEHECTHIDHLLAIHAAAVEMFEAEREFRRTVKEMAPEPDSIPVIEAAAKRIASANKNLAALCGWKAEEP